MIIVDDFDLLEEAQTLRRNINKMNKADIDSALTDLEDRLERRNALIREHK